MNSNEEETAGLALLTATYEALTHAVASPIAINGVFYDACEDEEEAKHTMFLRINNFGRDLGGHIQIYKRLRDKFYDVGESMNINHRGRLAVAIQDIAKLTLACGNLVERHLKKKLETECFLEYPFSKLTTYTAVNGFPGHAESSFNLERNLGGLISDSLLLGEFAKKVVDGKTPFPRNDYAWTRDSAEGLIQETLRARVDLTEEMLKRAGMFELGL